MYHILHLRGIFQTKLHAFTRHACMADGGDVRLFINPYHYFGRSVGSLAVLTIYDGVVIHQGRRAPAKPPLPSSHPISSQLLLQVLALPHREINAATCSGFFVFSPFGHCPPPLAGRHEPRAPIRSQPCNLADPFAYDAYAGTYARIEKVSCRVVSCRACLPACLPKTVDEPLRDTGTSPRSRAAVSLFSLSTKSNNPSTVGIIYTTQPYSVLTDLPFRPSRFPPVLPNRSPSPSPPGQATPKTIGLAGQSNQPPDLMQPQISLPS